MQKNIYTSNTARHTKHQELSPHLAPIESLFKKIQDKPGKYNIENTLGYRSIVSYLKNEINLDEAISQAAQTIRNYAKRQYTWFKNQFPDKIILSYDSNIEEIQEKFFKIVDQRFNYD